jgi:carboxylate-amine ligase
VRQSSFAFGIEEEYFLVDTATRDLVTDPPPGLGTDCRRLLGGRVHPELLRCQIEVSSSVCDTTEAARSELVELRRTAASSAANYGIALFAASTHPFGDWNHQLCADRKRYTRLERQMHAAIRRHLVCGLHVHVAIENDALRFHLFRQIMPFLPYFLALSVSSPFWRGVSTGLHSYRQSVLKGTPRSGLPPTFGSRAAYDHAMGMLVRSGQIRDATEIWWGQSSPTARQRPVNCKPLMRQWPQGVAPRAP